MRGTRTSKARGAIAAFVLVAGLAACGGGTDDQDASTTTAGGGAQEEVQPRAGGTLTVLHWIEGRGFDPAAQRAMTTATGPRMTSVFDALVVENAETGELEMRLAESMESDDGITWTVSLRPDVTFTDGTPFDAEAVQFNWARLEGIAPITSVTVDSPLTLSVVLPAADTEFPRRIASTPMTWIGSPTAIEAKGEAFNDEPVGAGPYMVDSWVRDSELVLVRNPDYYGETYLDEIVMRTVPDDTQRVATLQSGGAEVAMSPVAGLGAEAEAAGFEVVRYAAGGGRTVQFNKTVAPFDDVRARRAIALALDAEALNDAVYNGEDAPVDHLLREDSPYYDEDARQPAPDAAEAQRLFDELAAEGRPVEFSILAFPVQAAEAEWFAGVLESFDNVEVTIDIPDSLQILPRVAALDYQMALSGVPILDPSSLVDYVIPGSQFYGYSGGYDNPEVTEALQAALSTFDEDERVAAYDRVQEVLAEDVVFSFYGALSLYYAFDGKVHGIEPGNMYSSRALLLWDRVWLEE